MGLSSLMANIVLSVVGIAVLLMMLRNFLRRPLKLAQEESGWGSARPPRLGSKVWRWGNERFGVLRLDFGQREHQKHLTLTFNFLSGLVWLLIALTAIWAAAAGVIKSGHLAVDLGGAVHKSPTLFPANSLFWQTTSLYVPFLAPLVYAAEAFGVAMLICIATVSGGAILGFLFGIPRPISENAQQSTPSTGGNGAESGPGKDGELRRDANLESESGTRHPGWQSITNLTQQRRGGRFNNLVGAGIEYPFIWLTSFLFSSSNM